MSDPSIPPESLLRHASFLRALAQGMLGDAHGAEDVVQDTWVAAFERPPKSPLNLRGWLGTVARHFALRSRRSEERRERRDRASARPEAIVPAGEVAESETVLRAVTDAVLALDEPYRTAILLRYFEDLDPARIAERQGIPLATVRSRLQRAHAKLRDRLDREFGGERRVWSLGLLALARGAPPVASVAPTTAIGALVMSTTTKVAIGSSVVLLGLAFWLGRETQLFGMRGVQEVAGSPPPLHEEAGPERLDTASPPNSGRLPAIDGAATGSSAAFGSLVVHVEFEETGEPAADSLLTVYPKGDADFLLDRQHGVTDAGGDCRFERVPAVAADVGDWRGVGARIVVLPGQENRASIVIPKGLTVRGIVVDRSGVPVPNAQISISWSTRDPGQLCARSGLDGTFLLRALRSAQYISSREARNGPSSYAYLSGNPGDSVDLRLVCAGRGGRIEGRVFDPTGEPVPDALVQIDDTGGVRGAVKNGVLQGTPLEERRTDAAGRFACDGLEPPQCIVWVRARGLAPWSDYARIEDGETTQVNVDLREGLQVHGTIRTSDGAPASGIWVGAGPPGESADVSMFGLRTRSGADGTYRMDGILPGPIEMWAEDRSRPKGQRLGRARSLLRGSAGENLEWNAVIDAGIRLTGSVLDERGAPLSDMNVRVFAVESVGGLSASGAAKTDVDGRFSVAGLPESGVHVEIYEGAQRAENRLLLVKDVKPGADDVILRVPDAARASATIIGKLVDAGGRPASAKVILERVSMSTWNSFPSDSRTGEIRIGPVCADAYQLRVETERGVLRTLGTHELARGQTLDLGTITLEHCGRLRIDLRHPDKIDKADLSYWVVAVDPEDEHAGFSLVADRMLEPQPLAPGSYVLRVRGLRVRAEDHKFRIESDTETRLEIDPGNASARIFRLVPPSGKPQVDKAHVEVIDEGGQLIEARDQETAEKTWLHALFSLAPGKYTVRATTTSGLHGEIVVHVGVDEMNDPIDILLE